MTILSLVVGCVLLFFMPETPYYLILKNKQKQGEKSLHWLRGKKYDISKDLDTINEQVENQRAIKPVNFKTLFTVGVYVKPLVVTLCLMFFQQFSGINAVSFNIQLIFDQANTGLSACKSSLHYFFTYY